MLRCVETLYDTLGGGESNVGMRWESRGSQEGFRVQGGVQAAETKAAPQVTLQATSSCCGLC